MDNVSNATPKSNAHFIRCTHLTTAFFILWGVVILYKLLAITIVDRNKILQTYERNSWRVGMVPVIRGRILDKKGVLLAWSVRYFSLHYQVPNDYELFLSDLTQINEILSSKTQTYPSCQAGDQILIKKDLTPEQILRLRKTSALRSRIHIKTRFERIFSTNKSALIDKIGRTKFIRNHEVGISGYERKFNETLTGHDGKYRVMVDKNNNWITETWEEVQAPVPGFDVYISGSSK